MPDYEDALDKYGRLYTAVKSGFVKSAYATGFGGIIEAVSKMAFGNRLGVRIDEAVSADELYEKSYGSIILEVRASDIGALGLDVKKVGEVTADDAFVYGDTVISGDEALAAWTHLRKGIPY